MQWILGLAAALVLTSAAAAQDVAPAQTVVSGSSAEPKCFDLDEDEQAALADLKKNGGYFEDWEFDCDSDWVNVELSWGPSLRARGENPLVERDDSGALTLRRLRLGGGNEGDYRLSRLDCKFDDDNDAITGTFLLDESNPWVKPFNGRRLLSLTAADCQLIDELLTKFDPVTIIASENCEPNGQIVLHAPSTITEVNDFKSGFIRHGFCDRIPATPESESAEGTIDILFNWLEGRTRESGRKVRR